MLAILNKRGMSWVVFVCGIVLTSIYFELPSILLKRPQSVHMQRQTDGASYALNYYQNKHSFFQPQVHHRFAENGYAVSEFPAVYFLAAKLYGFFGIHDYFIRVLHFMLFLLGVFYLYKLSRMLINNSFFQLLPVLFFFSSTYIQYYASNFLPDVASLSLAFIGLYYFMLFKRENKYVFFVIAGCCFTMAGLLKISAIILWVSILLFYVFEWIQAFREKKKKHHYLLEGLIFFVSFIILFAWLVFDRFYADKYHYGGNLLGFYPIWDASLHEILSIFHRLVIEWMGVIMTWPMWFCMIGMFIYLMKWRNRMVSPLFFIMMMSGFGCFVYSLCWFRAFYHHDYYMINLFCFPVLIMILFLSLVESNAFMQSTSRRRLTYALILCLFTYSFVDCATMLGYRYSAPKYYTINPTLYEVEPYIRSIGIERNDLVVSVPDSSTNISLYLMNQPGWTECFNSSTYNIHHFISVGAKYLIVSDSNYIHRTPYKEFCQEEKKIGSYKGIFVYDLK